MIYEIDIKDFFAAALPLIDVRSPAEYEKGHIPGAVNIPLFSDAERAHIGTLYAKQSPVRATDLAFRYAEPKLAAFITDADHVAKDGKVAVHCWRGGMRSRMFAEHLHYHGFGNVALIRGGYKAYRTYLHVAFDIPCKINIIGGYTGSGKTLIMRKLRDKGFQVIDLEELARHKGSAFGGIGHQLQPTVEQFENDLFEQWMKLDHSKTIWIEDESHNIGGVNIPMNLYRQMLNSPVYFLDIPKKERAGYLVEDYAGAPVRLLAESIQRISRRIGSLNTRYALQYLEEKKFYELAMLVLSYYDKAYLKGMRLHDPGKVITIARPDTDPVFNTESIINLFHENERDKTHSI